MDLQKKIKLIKNNEAVAMLAPAFPIDFKYPNVIGMLRRLGFKSVTELTFGARMVNWEYANYIKNNPKQKLFIASPCPTVVALIKSQYPELLKYLMPVVSPMASMARIHKKQHPKCKIIFISPCWAKENLEAPKYKEIDAVITFKDLKQIFEQEGIKEESFVCPTTEKISNKTKNGGPCKFDSFIREYTKIYPVSGGLAITSHIKNLFKPKEILITDGPENIRKVFEDFKFGLGQYKFMDILNCPGGCIGGPAIDRQDLSTEERKKIILKYARDSSASKMGKRHKGKITHAKDVNLKAIF